MAINSAFMNFDMSLLGVTLGDELRKLAKVSSLSGAPYPQQ